MQRREVKRMWLLLLFLNLFDFLDCFFKCLLRFPTLLVNTSLMLQLSDINTAFVITAIVLKFLTLLVAAQEKSDTTSNHFLIVSQSGLLHDFNSLRISPY